MSDDDLDFSPASWRSQAHAIEESLKPRGLPVSDSDELRRVLALPRRPPVVGGTPTADALVHIAMQKYSRGPRACRCQEIDPDRPCMHTLLWIQAWMLYEAEQVGGLIANVAVGAGKTLPFCLMPLAVRDCRLALLLIPPSLVDQIQTDYALFSEHFRVPGMILHLPGNRTKVWDAQPRPAQFGGGVEPTMHVLPYSRLSSIKSSDWIERMEPDLIICDECDAISSMESARTLRLLRAFQMRPQTRFCGGTGSLVDNSIREFAHISALALRYGSPLPLERQIIDEWAQAVDAVSDPSPPGALLRFLEPGEGITEVRRAFGRRLAETPGFVMVGGRQAIETAAGRAVEFNVRARPSPPIPPIVAKALDMVRGNVRPDTLGGGKRDEIILDKLEQARTVREVATGMFYKWEFNPINGVEQDPLTIATWLYYRQEYFAAVRRKTARGELHLDSPGLCEAAARRAFGDLPKDPNLPEWPEPAWPPWRDIMDRVIPTPTAVRLDPFLVDDAIRWALEHRGIVWYAMKEFAEWMAERARQIYGVEIPVYGEGSGEDILKERGDRSIIASIKSHGRGRNKLQYRFCEALLAQSPASSRMQEQVHGRIHRRGQENDVTTDVYIHTPELQDSFDQALRRAGFVKDLTRAEQKLLDGWGAQGR